MARQRSSKGSGRRADRPSAPAVYCQFEGCDVEAAGHVGVVALCALHRQLVVSRMEAGVPAAAETPVKAATDEAPVKAASDEAPMKAASDEARAGAERRKSGI